MAANKYNNFYGGFCVIRKLETNKIMVTQVQNSTFKKEKA